MIVMSENEEKYNKYLKKQEILGIKTFEIDRSDKKNVIYIKKYIPNNETERLVKIPDFV